MVAGRGGVKKDGRKPSALEELFGSASDSEASTFYGFDDAELEDILFSNSDEDSWLTPDDGNSWVAASLGCKGHFLEREWKIFFGGANWDDGGSTFKGKFHCKDLQSYFGLSEDVYLSFSLGKNDRLNILFSAGYDLFCIMFLDFSLNRFIDFIYFS